MPPFRFRSAAWLALPLLALSGCNYIHFGRLPQAATDQELAAENTDLRVQKKMLQQELALARKEGDALRALIEDRSAPTGAAAQELAAKLNETTRELAALRVNYARLQEQRTTLQSTPRNAGGDNSTFAALEQVADVKSKLAATEEKLASTLRTYTQLQEDNARLRSEIDVTRTENSRLTTQVKDLTAQYKEAQAAMADLNSEFLAQKVARAQAEQEAEAVRAQLQAVMARPAAGTASLGSARETSATGARELAAPVRIANLPGDPNSTAMLATNPDRLRAAAARTNSPAPATSAAPATAAPAAASRTAPAPTPAPAPAVEKPVARITRLYVVKDGDTLESIARQYYGRPERWTTIYAANNSQLSGGRPLKPGMRLDIPSE
jgi:nucleoid-associated protein YgaU